MFTTRPITVTVNGLLRQLDVAVHHTLLDVLRDDLALTGTKECCLVGECGACTVIVDGRTSTPAWSWPWRPTGPRSPPSRGSRCDGRLSPLQQAFLDTGAVQCGFCIPGQLVSGTALLAQNPHPTVPEIQEGLAGNLCRCAGYQQITEAVLAAAEADDR